jgi:hypothetical protein
MDKPILTVRGWALTRARAIWAAIGLLALILGVVAFIAVSTLIRLNHTVTDVQSERVRNTRTSCLEQNAKNTGIQSRFLGAPGDARPGLIPAPTPQQRLAVRALADEGWPVKDCDELVKERVASAR